MNECEWANLAPRVLYTMSTDKFWETWEGIFIAFMVLGGVQWMYGVLQASRRRQTRDPDAKSLMHAIGTAAGAMATSFLIILLCGSGYWFLFFKAQTEAGCPGASTLIFAHSPLDSFQRSRIGLTTLGWCKVLSACFDSWL